MKIVIVGAGFTGIQLAKRLIDGKNDVTLIDNDDETVRHAQNLLDCDVIQTDGNNLPALEQAGIAKADALVCVTSNDEVNMITCSLVDSVYPEVLKIARVRNYAYYLDSKDSHKNQEVNQNKKKRPLYGIDYMIHPDVEAADAIVNAVEHGTVTDVIPFGEDFELIRVKIEKGSALENTHLFSIRKLIDKPVLVAYIEHDEVTSLPSGNTTICTEDCLGILMHKADIPGFLKLCGSEIKELKRIALVGAGRVGILVAEKLIHRKKNFFSKLKSIAMRNPQNFLIIENDEKLAKSAADRFRDARVFQADFTDESFLQEEEIPKSDLVIYTTPNFEMNIVLAAYIESLGAKTSVSLVSSSAFAVIARKIGIEVAVPIRDTVVDSILSHLRGKSVTGIHTVNDGSLETLEITISEKSGIKGKKIMEVAENGKFLIMMVQKSNEEVYQIPVGNTVLSVGDKIVVIVTKENNQHVLEKFS